MPTASHHPQYRTSLHRIRLCYFIHENQGYSVETAPASVFQAAITEHIDPKQLADNNMLQEAESVLSGDDDIYSRWWLLCYAAKSMRLYDSREQAELALQKLRENSASTGKIKQPATAA